VLDWLRQCWERPRFAPPEPAAAQVIAADLAELLEELE
jgi:hypothetical protein